MPTYKVKKGRLSKHNDEGVEELYPVGEFIVLDAATAKHLEDDGAIEFHSEEDLADGTEIIEEDLEEVEGEGEIVDGEKTTTPQLPKPVKKVGAKKRRR